MNYRKSTQVLNSIFDVYLRELKLSEVAVLLVIIRKTIGWYDYRTKRRKYKDWISYRQFKEMTELSVRTISKAIHTLVTKRIIEVTDRKGNVLDTPDKRKGKVGNFYRCLLYDVGKNDTTKEKISENLTKNIPITKLTHTKLNKRQGRKKITRLSDTERYKQIISMIQKR